MLDLSLDFSTRSAKIPGLEDPGAKSSRKGTNGVSTKGVTADLMFFDRGTFRVLSFR